MSDPQGHGSELSSPQRAVPAGVLTPMQRLYVLRWLLLALALMLTGSVIVHELPVSHALGAYGIILLLGAFLPQRRALVMARRAATRSPSAWPDTGMKVTVDALSQPCFIIDRRGVTRYVNTVASQRFPSVKPGDPLSFGLRPPALLEALDRVAAGGCEERISWAEKVPTESWFEAYIAPMELPRGRTAGAGQPDFVLVSVRDLSEQHRLERMRADFVANASHELRTPLASLTGFIDTLQGAAREDPVARDRFLKIMQEQAERMGRLIDDLLSLSRIELKAHVRPDARADLGEIARSVAEALGPVVAEQGVTLDVDLPDEPMTVVGERDELVQVLGNLVENAAKYGMEGERVLVGCSRETATGERGAEWRLSVRDWGPGIAAKHLPRLTERFYRVEDSNGRLMKGTGLGLAIVKHILNRHRARLEVKSAPGEGAIFTICIRAEEEETVPAATAAQ